MPDSTDNYATIRIECDFYIQLQDKWLLPCHSTWKIFEQQFAWNFFTMNRMIWNLQLIESKCQLEENIFMQESSFCFVYSWTQENHCSLQFRNEFSIEMPQKKREKTHPKPLNFYLYCWLLPMFFLHYSFFLSFHCQPNQQNWFFLALIWIHHLQLEVRM